MRVRFAIRMRLLAALLLVLAVAVPACRQDPGAPPVGAFPPASPDAYPGGELLASAEWLHDHLGDPHLRIIDASPLHDYRRGHVPGAVHLWWQDTIEVHNPVYGMLAGEPIRERLIREAGITPESTVVIYDAGDNRYAARILWMLHVIGVRDVKLLNGGRLAWEAAGYPLTADEPPPRDGGVPQQLSYDALIGAEFVVAGIQAGEYVVVDNRTPEERRETWFGRLRVGRIPGAVLIPWSELVEPGPVPWYRAPEDLRRRFEAAGVTPDRTVVVYGLHGVHAAQTWVALKLLGYPSVTVYDGSWAEWGARADLPIAPLPATEAAG